MFGKFCQSLLSWFSGAGCVDNHNFKTLNYDDTSGPLRLSTQSFSTGWCLPAFGFYILLSSIVSLQEIVKMICFWAVHILNPCCSTLPWIGLRRAGYTYIYICLSLSLSLHYVHIYVYVYIYFLRGSSWDEPRTSCLDVWSQLHLKRGDRGGFDLLSLHMFISKKKYLIKAPLFKPIHL